MNVYCCRGIDRLSTQPFQRPVDGIEVFRQHLVGCQSVVPAVKCLVSLVAGDFLPLPRIAVVLFVHQMFGQQAVEIAQPVVIPAWEMGNTGRPAPALSNHP